MSDATPALPFSEKSFYLDEFRGRTIAFALAEPCDAPPLLAVLDELARNQTRSLLFASDPAWLEALLGEPPEELDQPLLSARLWRRLRARQRAGVQVPAEFDLATRAGDTCLRLGVTKLVWIDRGGGLVRPDGGRVSFVDMGELEKWIAGGGERAPLLACLRSLVAAGLPAVNLCTVDGLGDELFTWSGSGTLLTRERYASVRWLGLDEFDAARDLVRRGVAEGFLVERSDDEIDRVLAQGFGAFIGGRHLAGIGTLLVHEPTGGGDGERCGEVASLYTLTRFLGEGVGGHLVAFALERAAAQGLEHVFACTTSERVAAFFERCGFERVPLDRLPASKWASYDAERRRRVIALSHATPVPESSSD